MKLIKKFLILVLVLVFRFGISESAVKVHILTSKDEVTTEFIDVKNESKQYEEINLIVQ